ncbi:MAG: hypothetical protein P9L90_03275 [Candidatus Aadella gelida]|nr:hypothetical protein [Candidatus Aadella gelida]
MGVLDSNLEPFEKIAAFLKEKKKTRSWLNTLSSREKLVPRPIRLPWIAMAFSNTLDINEKPRRRKQGSLVFYAKGTTKYLEEVIQLHKEGLSYEEIKNRLKNKLEVLNRLLETEFIQEKRRRNAGFFDNYRFAVKIFKYFKICEPGAPLMKVLEGIEEERKRCGKEYYGSIIQMRKHAHSGNAEYRKEQKKKYESGEKLDLLHALMEATTKEALEYINKKEGGDMGFWLGVIREKEKENK